MPDACAITIVRSIDRSIGGVRPPGHARGESTTNERTKTDATIAPSLGFRVVRALTTVGTRARASIEINQPKSIKINATSSSKFLFFFGFFFASGSVIFSFPREISCFSFCFFCAGGGTCGIANRRVVFSFSCISRSKIKINAQMSHEVTRVFRYSSWDLFYNAHVSVP